MIYKVSDGINRREFLKYSAAGVGALWLGSFLGTSIVTPQTKNDKNNTSQKKGKDILDDEFGPLSDNSVFATSNYDFFVDIIKKIDPSIVFKRGTRLDYKNKAIIIPLKFTYGDIPDFMKLVKEKLGSKGIELIFDKIKKEYEDRAYFVFKAGQKAGNYKLYEETAFKLYTISCLYSGIKNEGEIRKGFEKLINSFVNNEVIEKEVNEIVVGIDTKLQIKISNFPEFKLSESDRKRLLKIYSEDKELFIEEYSKAISAHINKLGIKNKQTIIDTILSIITTTVKVNEVSGKNNAETFNSVVAKTENFCSNLNDVNSGKFEKKAESFLSQKIDKGIQISLKKDFEKGVFYVMTNELNPQLKGKLDSCISDVFITLSIDKEESTEKIKKGCMIDYIKRNFKQTEIEIIKQKFSLLLDKNPKAKITEVLSKNHQDAIKKLQNEYARIYESELFKLVLKDGREGKFDNIKNRLMYLNDSEKSKIYYILLSRIGNSVYNKVVNPKVADDLFDSMLSAEIDYSCISGIVKKNKDSISEILFRKEDLISDKRVSKYQAGNYQISKLKEKNGKYNCVTISTMMNYIIEEKFGLAGKGVAVFKLAGLEVNHLANGVTFGDKLLWIDVTNNEYYLVDSKKFEKNYYFDTMDFANAYFQGAVDTIGIDDSGKYFVKDKLSYIKGYLNLSGDEANLSNANRNRYPSYKKRDAKQM